MVEQTFKNMDDHPAELEKEIAKNQRSEEEIRIRHERLNASESIGNVGSWEYDFLTNRIWISDEGFRIYGLEPTLTGELPVDEIEAFIPEREKVHQALVDLINEKNPYDQEFAINPANGGNQKFIRSIARLIRDEKGNPVKVAGNIRDITNRIRMQDEIRRLNKQLEQRVIERTQQLTSVQKRYSLFFNLVPEITVVSTVKEGLIIEVNESFERNFGFSRDEVIGKSAIELNFWADLGEREKVVQILEEKGRVHNFEAQFCKKSGELFSALCSMTLFEIEGKPCALSMLNDITDRKRAEEELRKAKEIAESATHAKSEFLSSMSHEIRTPMNAIIGMTRILLNMDTVTLKFTKPIDAVIGVARQILDMDTMSHRKHYLEIIEAAGKNLLTIINDILDLSKIEANKIEFEYECIDIVNTLKEIEKILYPSAHNKQIKFIVEKINSPSPIIKADSTRLKQILLNLGNNAIKFTNKGKVSISLSTVDETDTHVTLSFSVKDTGIGIPRNKIKDLFKPFSQLSEHRQKKQGTGTGLGLVISKRLVELMGGEINVKSEKGKGSEFWFVITFEKASAIQIIESTQDAGKDDNAPANLKILLAEDNIFNQEVIKGLLQNQNHQLTIVNNGKEAVKILENNSFDVILMDIQMPEMDGLTATKLIRDKNSMVMNHEIPIIAMTAYAMKEDRDLCLQSGMNGYVSKPIDLKKLIQEIKKLLITQVKPDASLNHHSDISDQVIFDSSNFISVMNDDKRLALNLIKTFLDDTCYPKYLSEIKQAIDEKNSENLQKASHALKGIIGYFSSSGKELASKLHNMGKTNDLSTANETFEFLNELIIKLRPLLEKFISDSEEEVI